MRGRRYRTRQINRGGPQKIGEKMRITQNRSGRETALTYQRIGDCGTQKKRSRRWRQFELKQVRSDLDQYFDHVDEEDDDNDDE